MSRSRFQWLFILLVSCCLLHSCMADENVKVEEITNETQRCGVGEGPHWDISKQSLYYVDIIAPSIQRFDAQTGEIFKATVNGDISAIGFIIPIEGKEDEFIIGADRKLLKIRWDGKASMAENLEQLGEVDECCPGNRINDGKCDPNGVLFFGTMGNESHPDFGKEYEGSFYRFSPQSGVKLQRRNIGISNGLAWDVKQTIPKFYYIDSLTRDIKEFNYTSSSSEIDNEKVLIDFNKTHKDIQFAADGMTIDENGLIYVATFGGSRIIIIDPKNKSVVREIPIPTLQVTSLAFGGPNLDILYVTSASKMTPKPPQAGGLFKVTGLGAKGLPMAKFKL